MSINYFTGLYTAHAVLRCWLKRKPATTDAGAAGESPSTASAAPTAQPRTAARAPAPPPARHLVFTASFLAFYSFAGYTSYSPAKAALRSLADTLSQEMNLYAAAGPGEPRVRAHIGFPATIFGDAYVAENVVKSDLTKMLEAGDGGQVPEVIAAKTLRALERGQELVTTDVLTALVKRSMLGGSVRGGFLSALGDWLLACLMGIVMVFVRDDMDRKVRAWGRKFGPSGMKEVDKQA